jgi:hypothetical protein
MTTEGQFTPEEFFQIYKNLMQRKDVVSVVGEWVAELTKGVTNIKSWSNLTEQEVEVWKLDGGSQQKDHYRIPPGKRIFQEMWIPWADNARQYVDHHATVRVGGRPLAYIWQSGPLVRFNTRDEFVADGVAAPGASGAGGDRAMVIATDSQGRTGFAIGTFRM